MDNLYLNECVQYIDKSGNVFSGKPRPGALKCIQWKTDIKKFRGTIINRMEYAEPVIYGTSLPPSWQGRYRTRQQTIKGFPELQAKQLTTGYIPQQLRKIIRSK